MPEIRAILFDKDGTLFDFQATWGAWAASLLTELSAGQPVLAAKMAQAIAFDLDRGRFLPQSPVIAGTGREVAELLAPFVADQSVDALEGQIARAAKTAPLAPAAPLRPLLTTLRDRGLCLGVATNDFEGVAREHVADVLDLFDFIAGFDSGYGAKPEPGMLLAFARQCNLRPENILMVGDSLHDLMAGRAAGMATLGVLTGVASAADLAGFADTILPDISHIPQMLA